MKFAYQAKLRGPSGIRLLDYSGSLIDGPDDDFIVCFNKDGSPASRFGDVAWNFTAYHPEQRAFRLYFSYWGDTEATTEQIKLSRAIRRIAFALIWHRPGPPLSLGTLANYVTVLTTAARHAEQNGVSLGYLFGSSESLLRYVDQHCSGWMCETLGSLLGVLAGIGEEAIGIKLVSTVEIQSLAARARNYRASIKQHAPIPTRIYSTLIGGLHQEITDWLAISEQALEMLYACGIDSYMGRSFEQQRDYIAPRLGVDFESVMHRPSFDDICPQSVAGYLAKNGYGLTVKGLSRAIGEVQILCKLIIQTFSGMRDDEASTLPYHCHETHTSYGRKHHLVQGRTTKFNNGLPKRVRWVNNHEGYQAIQVAQKIADCIYRAYDVVMEEGGDGRLSHPLFPSVGYMNLAAKPMNPVDGHFLTGKLEIRPNSRLRSSLFASIEDGDLRELEQIDLHRAWRSEEAFQIGKRWSFKSHQLRRSLALYAQRSGVVSLPSLRRQLQHLTEEMSRYYAKGSSFASDFIGEQKDHFGLEWQNTESESAALSYIFNVLLSDEKLLGGHASWVQHRLKGSDGTVLVDREATMKLFRKGELAYRDTLLGGCTKVGDCDEAALNWLNIDCLRNGCKNLVCNPTKLNRVIAAQERLVTGLDPKSVEYRTEVADLAVLRQAVEKINSTTAGALQ